MSEEKDPMKEFDVIVLGTGLKECVLSGLMSSVAKKRVLHIDRNAFYGGESASLNLDQLCQKFRGPDAKPDEAALGRSRDYCVDLCPKFLMACGDLVKILLKTQVTHYLEFKSVAGSYVVKDGKIHKVPATAKEALATSLMGMFEKRRFKSFLQFCADYSPDNPASFAKYDPAKMTASELYKAFGLDANTQSFTGHAMALNLDDTYLDGPATDLVERISLYANSVIKYGNSPYIYPKYGLGGLPEGFSRRCAVHGGTFMLNMGEKAPFVKDIRYDDSGKVVGITMGDDVAAAYEIPTEIACKQIIADPSYFHGTDKVKKVGQVVRCIAIFEQPVAGTKDADSCQIIIPNAQTGRKSDIYMCVTSYLHNIAAQGRYVAVCATAVETDSPEAELAPALKLLPPLKEKFVWVSDSYEPTGNGSADNCFITTTYDATTHFQTCANEIMAMYQAITGEPLDMNMTEEVEAEA